LTEATDLAPLLERYAALRERVGRVVVGQDEAVRLATITLLCGGHSLIEGVPGVAKTLLVRTLASALGVRFGRVQFTPDLMPSDILGTPVLDPRAGEFHFRAGPIFTDLLLADEINRASPKTQAALLEAMQEGFVTVDGVRHPLGEWFTVFATQNPVEQEGTYPLPEAELDRFLFKIVVDYPDEEDERALLALHHAQSSQAQPGDAVGGGAPGENASEPVLGEEELARARKLVRGVIVRDEILAYVSDLVRATRADFQFALGASPRAGLLLLRAAKAQAALDGRDYVLPEDVQAVFFPALRHRVVLDPASEVEGLTADAALERTLRTVTVPR
jgi:MoxR-like ATPase